MCGLGREATDMAGTRRRPGRMGPFIESYREVLLGRGYTPLTVRGLLQHVGALGQWMEAKDLVPADLDIGVLEDFVADRRAGGRSEVRTTRSIASLLDHLQDLGVVAPMMLAPVDPLIAEYRVWMVEDRGLAPSTVLRYENLAVRFLEGVGDRPLGSLTGRDVSGFLLAETARVSVGSAKGRVAEMRSLLRCDCAAALGVFAMSHCGDAERICRGGCSASTPGRGADVDPLSGRCCAMRAAIVRCGRIAV